MKSLRLALVAGMLAACGCSRQAAATPATSYDGAATFSYLESVGKIRAQANADNKERIPPLILGVDTLMLGNEASRFSQFKQTILKLPTDKVDPDAVQFAQNFEGIIDAYAAVCSDAAELFREAKHEDDVRPDSTPILPMIHGLLAADPRADAIGSVTALTDAMEHLNTVKAGYLTLDPITARLRDDKEKLVAAKEVHHLFTIKVKADFTQRYPSVNWTDREALPP
jgi:hypothetical protein